jgi:hypothetical protein
LAFTLAGFRAAKSSASAVWRLSCAIVGSTTHEFSSAGIVTLFLPHGITYCCRGRESEPAEIEGSTAPEELGAPAAQKARSGAAMPTSYGLPPTWGKIRLSSQ